jgi:hypothetical protein
MQLSDVEAGEVCDQTVALHVSRLTALTRSPEGSDSVGSMGMTSTSLTSSTPSSRRSNCTLVHQKHSPFSTAELTPHAGIKPWTACNKAVGTQRSLLWAGRRLQHTCSSWRRR